MGFERTTRGLKGLLTSVAVDLGRDERLPIGVAEATHLFEFHVQARYQLVAARQLPVVRLGRSVRVIRSNSEA